MPSLLEFDALTDVTKIPEPADGRTFATLLPDPAARPHERAIPEIPGFTIQRVIGQGGMGTVYEAVDKLGLRFAIKMMRREMSAANQKRFREEAQAMAALKHPNIAGILTYGSIGDRPYFVMEYFPGGTLHDRKADYQADPRKAARLLAKVADALAYLHRAGVIHRDIKPQNILLDKQGEPRLSDFGLVKRFSDELDAPAAMESADGSPESASADTADGDSRQDTRDGTILGTPQYMGPEQARGMVNEAGPAWDVWSLGVVLYELVAGKLPFAKGERGFAEPAAMLGGMPPPSSVKPSLDHRLDRLVASCLMLDPARRPRAVEVRQKLQAYADPLPMHRKPAARIAVLSTAAIVFACLALFAWRPWSRTVEQVQDDMQWEALNSFNKDGGELTIVDEDGKQVYPIKIASPRELANTAEQDGALTLSATNSTFMDLLPNRPNGDFRLEFEFKLRRPLAKRFSCGFYIGRRSGVSPADQPTQRGLLLYLETDRSLAWNDDQPLSFVRQGEPVVFEYSKNGTFKREGIHALRAGNYILNPVDPTAWHRLALEVRGDRAELHLDDAPLGFIRQPELKCAPALARIANNFGEAVFDPFDPNGGVGIYIYGGSMSIRKVRLASPAK